MLGLATLASAAPAGAEPAPPRGALDLTSELLVTGGAPRQRAGVALTAYLTQRLGLRAAAHLVTVDPAGDAGLATLGIAYRAAAARPRLELVVRVEAGATWGPVAPAVGGGTTAYLWPTRLPLALTFDLGAMAIVDGIDDSRLALSLGIGLALAR